MRSILTVTPFLLPQSAAHLSRYVSKSGTKWLHCRMLRFPLSFGEPDAPPLVAAVAVEPPVPLGCAPMHEARTGAAAVAAPPFSSVRRLTRALVVFSSTRTSCQACGKPIPHSPTMRHALFT